jgi:hypothetical protein
MNKMIAIIFDFDDTLAHDSTTDFLSSFGIDTKMFWSSENKKLIEAGWDPIPAYMYQMIEWSRNQNNGNKITKKKIESFGKNVRFFEGVQRLFGHLSDFVEKNDSDFKVEFYVVSSGIGDLIRHSKIAKHFKDVFASDFHYNEMGEICYPKKIVSFTDKTRYIFQISKGFVGRDYYNKPFEVNRKIESSQIRIPLCNMIFIGDGYTDVPCFSLLNKNRGTAFAVYDKANKEKKYKAWGFIEDGRVKNLHSVNYTKASDLISSIEMSIGSIITKAKNAYMG